MVAADALDREHRAVGQPARGGADGVAGRGEVDWQRLRASSSRAAGPQAGQAFGCAWKRRSPGSSYSRRHAAHIAKPAIVVTGRSYGTPRTIVKRGPQFVQLMNG